MMTQQIDVDTVPVLDIDVELVPLPGAVKGNGYQCPNCSLTLIDWDNEADKKIVVPADCTRCGCPMDRKRGKEFSDAHALHTPKAQAQTSAAAEAKATLAEATAILAEARAERAAAESALAAVAKAPVGKK